MRRQRNIIVATFLAVVAVMVGYFPYATRSASLSDDEWDICEVVLRYQINDPTVTGTTGGPSAAFVEIQGLNPTRAFLDRFEANSPSVNAGWQYSPYNFGRRVVGVFGLKRTTPPGGLYFISSILRTGEDSAVVVVGYREPSFHCSSTFLLIRKDGKWIVESVEKGAGWFTCG